MEWKDAIKDRSKEPQKCAACGVLLEALGKLPMRTGGTAGAWHLLLGDVIEVGERVQTLDVFRCPSCRRVELFDLELNLPRR